MHRRANGAYAKWLKQEERKKRSWLRRERNWLAIQWARFRPPVLIDWLITKFTWLEFLSRPWKVDILMTSYDGKKRNRRAIVLKQRGKVIAATTDRVAIDAEAAARAAKHSERMDRKNG